jgi:hypothetical protein
VTAEQIERLAELKRRLARRKGQPGWGENVKAIGAAIAEIENGG